MDHARAPRDPRPADALIQLDLAERDPALAGATLDLGVAATFRGRAHLQLGDLDDAAEQAAGALQMLGPSAHVERVSALLLLGDVGTAQLEIDLAQESYGEAETVLARMMPDPDRGAALARAGRTPGARSGTTTARSRRTTSRCARRHGSSPDHGARASTRQGSYSVAR